MASTAKKPPAAKLTDDVVDAKIIALCKRVDPDGDLETYARQIARAKRWGYRLVAQKKLTPQALAKMPLGASRFGGPADLPRNLDWPTTASGPMQFLTQLMLSELPASPARDALPERGILYFFAEPTGPTSAGRDRNVHCDPGNPPCLVHWHPTEQKLRRQHNPDPQAEDPYLAPIPHAISWLPIVTLPPNGEDRFDFDLEAYPELQEAVDRWLGASGPKHQLLGHPGRLHHPLSANRLVLQLACDERLHFHPLSDGRCFFTASDKSLRDRQFQRIVCEQHRW